MSPFRARNSASSLLSSKLRLSQIEILTSVVIGLLLFLLGLPFYHKMMQNIERTALQQILRQLNAAATLKMAEYVALDKLSLMSEQVRVNPISWLDIREMQGWGSYQGEASNVNFAKMDEQTWIYDQSLDRLIYKVAYPELLVNSDPVANKIQFKVDFDYVDYNENGQFDSTTETINGLMIVALYPYRWQSINDDDD